MSERVRPDVVDAVLPEDAFYLSTILRVIDEEIDRGVIMPYHDGEDPPSTIDVLEALRARFEEADDE